MMMRAVVLVFVCGLAVVRGLPTKNDERSALIQEQADENYKHHQEVLSNKDYSSASLLDSKGGYNSDGSFGVTFDNKDKDHRDRGYGYEKAYAYSRETAFIDFYDDKGALNARDIVEKYGKEDEEKSEDLLSNISH